MPLARKRCAAPGMIGLALRGTSGRLDDFGGR